MPNDYIISGLLPLRRPGGCPRILYPGHRPAPGFFHRYSARFRLRAGYVGFVYYGKPETAGPHVCISFNCASEAEVDREYQRICQLGYPTKAPPARHPTQPVYSFFLQDPNGYTVEFEKLEGLAL